MWLEIIKTILFWFEGAKAKKLRGVDLSCPPISDPHHTTPVMDVWLDAADFFPKTEIKFYAKRRDAYLLSTFNNKIYSNWYR